MGCENFACVPKMLLWDIFPLKKEILFEWALAHGLVRIPVFVQCEQVMVSRADLRKCRCQKGKREVVLDRG